MGSEKWDKPEYISKETNNKNNFRCTGVAIQSESRTEKSVLKLLGNKERQKLQNGVRKKITSKPEN